MDCCHPWCIILIFQFVPQESLETDFFFFKALCRLWFKTLPFPTVLYSLGASLTSIFYFWGCSVSLYTLRGTCCVQWATRVQTPEGPSLLTQAMTLDMSSPCDCLGPSIRQEYRSGLPFPPPGDCPDRGIKLQSPVSPASYTGSL